LLEVFFASKIFAELPGPQHVERPTPLPLATLTASRWTIMPFDTFPAAHCTLNSGHPRRVTHAFFSASFVKQFRTDLHLTMQSWSFSPGRFSQSGVLREICDMPMS
jgi:hypothetical protein